jgi:hypothetical protein
LQAVISLVELQYQEAELESQQGGIQLGDPFAS